MLGTTLPWQACLPQAALHMLLTWHQPPLRFVPPPPAPPCWLHPVRPAAVLLHAARWPWPLTAARIGRRRGQWTRLSCSLLPSRTGRRSCRRHRSRSSHRRRMRTQASPHRAADPRSPPRPSAAAGRRAQRRSARAAPACGGRGAQRCSRRSRQRLHGVRGATTEGVGGTGCWRRADWITLHGKAPGTRGLPEASPRSSQARADAPVHPPPLQRWADECCSPQCAAAPRCTEASGFKTMGGMKTATGSMAALAAHPAGGRGVRMAG